MNNMDQPPNIDQNTVEYVAELFKDAFAGIIAQHANKIEELEKALEGCEKQIATLVLGYGEQAVFMEALVAQMAFASDEARTAFQDNLNEARKKMLEVMQDASSVLMGDDEQRIASAIENMAEQELSNSNE